MAVAGRDPADHRGLHHTLAAVAKKQVGMADRTGIDRHNPFRLQPVRKPLSPHKRAQIKMGPLGPHSALRRPPFRNDRT